LKKDDELAKFSKNLQDRFGKVPEQTEELIRAVKLRQMAQNLGFERLILKNKLMTGVFISDKESAFFKSSKFDKILTFVTSHLQDVVFQENNGKLKLQFKNVYSVKQAIELLGKLC
jgi:transcription-repair coupling factor (superfamily II helicase)